MDIELYNGATKAIISTKGGYVTNLSDDKGDVLFPKRVLTAADGSEKTRGGCHVCLPNFGPGGESGLEQHGFGRTNEWRIVSQSSSAVELVLAGEGAYADMESFLRYEVAEGRFTLQLTLKNKGTVPLIVSPGFHPYFYRGKQAPTIDGTVHEDLSMFAEVRFIDGISQHIVTAGRHVQLESQGLPRYALWTDQLGDYVCIEPTQSGNAFLEDVSRADTLSSGGKRAYRFTIDWQ